MPTSPRAQRTDFSLDIAGRYICNGLDEALASLGPGTRAFDLIVLGGGSFGAALAEQLFANDQAQVHRILVLEGGPLALPEHVQNMPLPGLGIPPATSISQLRSEGLDGQPREEVWGLPWQAVHCISVAGRHSCLTRRCRPPPTRLVPGHRPSSTI